MLYKKENFYLHARYQLVLLLIIVITAPAFAQQTRFISGKIMGATSAVLLNNVSVHTNNATKIIRSSPDGMYSIHLQPQDSVVYFNLPGYASVVLTGIPQKSSELISADIQLYPLTTQIASFGISVDSLPIADSLRKIAYRELVTDNMRKRLFAQVTQHRDNVHGADILPGRSQNPDAVLKFLNNVSVNRIAASRYLPVLIINGMSDRYNQVRYNNAPLTGFGSLLKSYPVDALPVESLGEVMVQTSNDGNLPAAFAGGIISFNSIDEITPNFFSVKAGIGTLQAGASTGFYRDRHNSFDFAGFHGKQLNLPAGFPSIRSVTPFASYNIQEQVYQSKLLPNNISPTKNDAQLPTGFLLSFGRLFNAGRNSKLWITGHLSQDKSELFEISETKVAPNNQANPYPYSRNDQAIVFGSSSDSTYRYTGRTVAVLNLVLSSARNKVSFRNFAMRSFEDRFTSSRDVYKPDEDSLAHAAIHNVAAEKSFLNSQLAGSHILGETGKLRLDWQSTFRYNNERNPDERNFLLRTGPVQEGSYELATPNTKYSDLPGRDPSSFPTYSAVANALFTNSGRRWRSTTDKGFNASMQLTLPFNLFNRLQVLTSGMEIDENFREVYSDFLLTSGKGFYPLDRLLAPDRYYPGGTSINSFFSNDDVNFQYFSRRDLGSYQASSNTGAAFISFDQKIFSRLALRWGFRLETSSNLASNTRYQFIDGFRNTRSSNKNKNTRVTSYDYLPSVNFTYSINKMFSVTGGYFASVNRPAPAELVPYATYDALAFTVTTGNILLASVPIHNFQAGINFLPGNSVVLHLGGFYKKIDAPIEYVMSEYGRGTLLSTPHNMPPATVKALEASFHINFQNTDVAFLDCLSIFSSGSIINSTVEAGPLRSTATPVTFEHRLSGTPRFVFNAGFIFHAVRFPELTVRYNETGDMITAVGSGQSVKLLNGNDIQSIPACHLLGRKQLDIQVSQKLIKDRLEIIAAVTNLLHSPVIRYQDLDGNDRYDKPIQTKVSGNSLYYAGGTDNRVFYLKQPAAFYFTLSYTFK